MHGQYKDPSRSAEDWRRKLSRDERVSRALQSDRRARKHEPEWVRRAKAGSLPSRDYTGHIRSW